MTAAPPEAPSAFTPLNSQIARIAALADPREQVAAAARAIAEEEAEANELRTLRSLLIYAGADRYSTPDKSCQAYEDFEGGVRCPKGEDEYGGLGLCKRHHQMYRHGKPWGKVAGGLGLDAPPQRPTGLRWTALALRL